MTRWIPRTMLLALLLLPVAKAHAQPAMVVVLDNKFQAMKIPLGQDWKLAEEFNKDKEASGYIVRISYAKPIPVPMSRRFVGGQKMWNDVAVRYPFKLSYRPEGKTTELAIAKGEFKGTASPLKVKDPFAAIPTYELRLTSLDELAKEAAQEAMTPNGVPGEVQSALISMVATPDPFNIGSVLTDTRRSPKGVTVTVPLKNRLPVRVTGELSRSDVQGERMKFALNPGEARAIPIPVDDAKLKGKVRVSISSLILDTPGAK